jgi:REP element-mobilizing transposase RayT
MTERLHRLEYVFQRLPIYFVTACTHERQRILNNADVHQQFVEFGIEGEAREAWLGAYILMPEHLHAFVVVDDERPKLSRWIKSLKNTVSKVLRGKGIRSPHWQKGFFDHMLRSGDSYSAKLEYVRENPVRGGLANNWREWPFIGEIFDLEFRDDRL